VPGVFEVWGRHGFPAPGTYFLEVRVFEDEVYSRGSAVSTVTLAQPTWPPLNDAWVRLYCDGSEVFGTGDPPLDFNVLDQNVETLGTTVRAEAGDALSNVIVGRYSGGAGATATAQVKWEPNGPWEAADATGGVITGSHTYTQSGSYAVSVILELHDTYVTGDPVLQECYPTPRVRSFLIMSGATIETPEPSINTSAVVIGVGQTVSASDLFAANDLADNAVAMIEWGDGDQSLVEFVNGLPDGSHQYDVDGFLTARITVRQGERVVVTCAHVTVEPSEAYALPLIPLDARSTALENENLLDAGIVLARITDTNPRHIGGLHDVLISWGDGTSSLGRIQWESGTTFTIKGDHSYAHSGAYGLRFHYRDQFDEVTFHGTIVVTAKSLVGQSIQSNAAVAVEREQWLVGEFEIDDAATISRQYRAAVDWGDGVRGNAEVSGAAGAFTVWGEHTYYQPGTFEVTVLVEDGYGVQEAVTIISTMEVAEAGAGKVTPINVVEFELLDWYESASGGGPGEPPPPAMGKSGIPLEKVDVVRGTGGLWRESKTGDLYKSRKENGTGTDDDGDTKILVAYWPNGEPAKTDGGDLPGVPAVSHEMRIIWGDPKLDSIDAVDAEFQIAWPAITRMVADHLYEVDTYGASGAPHPLTGRVYGVDITRELDVADVTQTQPVIHGFEDYALDDVMLLTFTKAEFNETDTVAHINWGDGSHDTAQVIENPDHTLAVRLDHVYTCAISHNPGQSGD